MGRPTRDDIARFHDDDIYVPTRTIYIGSAYYDPEHGESGCDGAMAERAVKNLRTLESINKDPITILMNNVGGDPYHGMAVYDAIRLCQSHVTIKVLGHAMSMGSVIFQAADHRLMAPNSRQMIHYGTWAADGHAKTTQKWAKECEKVDKWMEQVYLKEIKEKQPHFTLARLQRMLDHDTFLTAEESVALGLADAVMGKGDL